MTMQCSGNRRSGYNVFNKTSGTTWGQGAISTAKWGGVRLSELLKNAGMGDPIEACERGGMEHVRFGAIDGMKVSIGIEKAANPYGDVMVCYEMNGEDLPRDHGHPLRVIVPGYAAVRSLKWVNSISISREEAEGPWQRGLNYKVLPPNVHDANEVNVDEMPSCNELCVSSGITSVEPVGGSLASSPNAGDVVPVRVAGWAFAGGGRNIVRVDVTGDAANHKWVSAALKEGSDRAWTFWEAVIPLGAGGRERARLLQGGGHGVQRTAGEHKWVSAALKEGSDQRYGRSWAWTFWEADVPAKVQGDGSVHVYCKGVDMAFNGQPVSAVSMVCIGVFPISQLHVKLEIPLDYGAKTTQKGLQMDH
eukprot:CAMPEP_0172575170 /NCGR_PEP_ID=MMETSP1067-20121228/137077_1 /TAXON_ID=265564 ORGANISM="Thalassiosira punctigera, Strain Tpunct2005C2" /NCGR_SAMPLE_ID=MMETSP1067 /ASSEMBLY_ACC=CAM_ASM_000444 /LENGTH=362 /DNA_ID=CAMNT_0013367817 /DNA_START=76 /DNA_END=1166 /DNA_ORIENTATION=-